MDVSIDSESSFAFSLDAKALRASPSCPSPCSSLRYSANSGLSDISSSIRLLSCALWACASSVQYKTRKGQSSWRFSLRNKHFYWEAAFDYTIGTYSFSCTDGASWWTWSRRDQEGEEALTPPHESPTPSSAHPGPRWPWTERPSGHRKTVWDDAGARRRRSLLDASLRSTCLPGLLPAEWRELDITQGYQSVRGGKSTTSYTLYRRLLGCWMRYFPCG